LTLLLRSSNPNSDRSSSSAADKASLARRLYAPNTKHHSPPRSPHERGSLSLSLSLSLEATTGRHRVHRGHRVDPARASVRRQRNVVGVAASDEYLWRLREKRAGAPSSRGEIRFMASSPICAERTPRGVLQLSVREPFAFDIFAARPRPLSGTAASKKAPPFCSPPDSPIAPWTRAFTNRWKDGEGEEAR